MGRSGEVSAPLLVTTCKNRLAVLWFAAGVLLIIVVALQTIFGKYGDRATEAWGWLLPNILPTLSVIIGVLVIDSQGKAMRGREAHRFLFYLTFVLSAVYLLLVAITIFMQPFITTSSIRLMKESNMWLGPFQGVVSGAMGAFFVKGTQGLFPR